MSKVVCLICGREFEQLSSHIKVHNLSINQYRELFPNAKTISDESHNKRSNSVSGKNNPFFGREHTEESKDKNRNTKNEFYLTERGKEVKEKLREDHIGIKASEATLKKMSSSHLKFYQTEEGVEFREQKSENWHGEKNINSGGVSDKHKKNIRICRRRFLDSKEGDIWKKNKSEERKNYCKSEDGRKHMKEMRKNQFFPTHHTKPELFFEEVCIKNSIPYRYTGDGSFWIPEKGDDKRCNPDFIIFTKKRKFAIEINGDYWHSPLLNPKKVNDKAFEERKKHFRKYKWFMIVFWESDIMHAKGEQYILSVLRKNKII